MDENVEDLVKKAMMDALRSRKNVEQQVVVEPAPVEPPEPEKPVVQLPGHVLSSEFFDFSHKIFNVRMFNPEDWHESMQVFLPEKDPNYVMPTSAVDVLRAWELEENVLAYGPTGSGKSSLFKQLCAYTNRPFVRVNATGDMDSSMVFGQLTAKDGSTVWEDGVVTEAVKHGAVLCWDEWEVTPPEIMMGMQWLLEDDRKLFLKEKPGSSQDKFIKPHKHFRVVCCGNTQGQGDDTGHHAGTNVQNSATIDRFSTCIKIGYMSPDNEETMLNNLFDGAVLSKRTVKQLVQLAGNIRGGYTANQLSLTMSPRTLISMGKKIQAGLTVEQAFNVAYCNKLTDTQQRVSNEMFSKIFGK